MKLNELWAAFRAADKKEQRKLIFGAAVLLIFILALAGSGKAAPWDNDEQGWYFLNREAMELMPADWQEKMTDLLTEYDRQTSWDLGPRKLTGGLRSLEEVQPEICFRNTRTGRYFDLGQMTVYNER